MRRLADDVEDVADAVAERVDEMEAPLVEVGLEVADVVERGDDEIDRDDVDAAALEADRRHPGRQQLAHALDQLEEVVRAVDLVHLAGLRVADDERGAVHRPRHLRLGANDLLALVLGHEVRMVEALGLVEHVLAKDAFVEAGRGDRADVVQVTGIDRPGELDDRARALDVDGDLRFGIGREVVDGGEVIDVIDLALELLDGLGGNAELLRGQVAVHRDDALAAGLFAPVLEQRGDLALAFGAQQEVDDGAAPGQQGLDETLADEARGSGDEIAHAQLPGRDAHPALACGGFLSRRAAPGARGKPDSRRPGRSLRRDHRPDLGMAP